MSRREGRRRGIRSNRAWPHRDRFAQAMNSPVNRVASPSAIWAIEQTGQRRNARPPRSRCRKLRHAPAALVYLADHFAPDLVARGGPMSNAKSGLCAALAPLFWALLVGAAMADDLVYTSQVDRFSIKRPNAAWSEKVAAGQQLAWTAANQAKTKFIVIAVIHSPVPADVGNPEFQRGFEDGYLKPANGKKIRGENVVIDGRPAYRLDAEISILGKKCSAVVLGVFSRGRVYSLSTQSFVGVADGDPELDAAINSFHLLDPPDPADVNRRGDRRSQLGLPHEQSGGAHYGHYRDRIGDRLRREKDHGGIATRNGPIVIAAAQRPVCCSSPISSFCELPTDSSLAALKFLRHPAGSLRNAKRWEETGTFRIAAVSSPIGTRAARSRGSPQATVASGMLEAGRPLKVVRPCPPCPAVPITSRWPSIRAHGSDRACSGRGSAHHRIRIGLTCRPDWAADRMPG